MKSNIALAAYRVVLPLMTALAVQAGQEEWTPPTPAPTNVTDWATVVRAWQRHETNLLPFTDWKTVPTNVFFENVYWRAGVVERGNWRAEVVLTRWLVEALSRSSVFPAEQDPEGHWGPPLFGFQLSVRFKKAVFTNGEPVEATVLLRNLSDDRPRWPVPAGGPVWFRLYSGQGLVSTRRVPAIVFDAKTKVIERRSQLRFELSFDPSEFVKLPGRYEVSAATLIRYPTEYLPVYIELLSGIAVIEIGNSAGTISPTNAPARRSLTVPAK